MARRFKSIDDYERHLRHKWGIGEKAGYKPWFTVKDVKNKTAFRKELMGLTVARPHHLLSALEFSLFLTMDFRDDVIDIREQFPLFPLALSRKIALTLGVEHPCVVGVETPAPFVMTTDLLVSFLHEGAIRYVAFCVKPEEHLTDSATLAKIDIERVWWESIGVTFKVFSGNDVVKTQSHNILWATDLQRHGLAAHLEPFLVDAAKHVPLGQSSKHGLCDTFAQCFKLDEIDALNLLRLLIGKKYIHVELSEQHLDVSRTVKVIENQYFTEERRRVNGG
ncbi:TnsA endonuclease N-terminal domain-containing protein [Vibrio parahaemolyticus]|jgi:hypothetical protein|uniref:TnsA endonuclease N-terminal domain-containing protein n=1 Tax=Vibrio parahaemolyticus TaxID=670 RepID=UPI003AAA5279|tara:strand:+ start:511 stop:1347 length:837 start_codon:yes stop_codon:yes gene_type:complete